MRPKRLSSAVIPVRLLVRLCRPLCAGQVAYPQYVMRGLVGWSAWSRYPTGQPPGCVASLGDLAVKGGWTECTPHEGARDRNVCS